MPAWFRDLIRPTGDGRSADIRVAFGAWDDALLGAAVDGVVAVNCRGLTTARLTAAGYGSVRRFAALPNITAARWVPAAGHARRGRRRVRRLLADAAVGPGPSGRQPSWPPARGCRGGYRDSVTIAQRQPPPLERQLAAGLSTTEDLRAVPLGRGRRSRPATARRRPPLLRLDGSVIGFAKLAGSPLATHLIRREAAVLAALAIKPAVADSVPRLLAAGEADGRYYLVQSPISGRAAPAKLTDDHRRFLANLQDGHARPAGQTEFVASLLPRLRLLGSDLAAAAERTVASLDECRVPSTIVHGDFAPWNLRCRPGGLAAFDWEYGRVDGLPAVDAAHHELQVGYNMHGWSPADAGRALDGHVHDHPTLSADHVVAMQNAYLLDVLARLAEEGYGPSDRMVAWHRALLADRIAATAEPTPRAA